MDICAWDKVLCIFAEMHACLWWLHASLYSVTFFCAIELNKKYLLTNNALAVCPRLNAWQFLQLSTYYNWFVRSVHRCNRQMILAMLILSWAFWMLSASVPESRWCSSKVFPKWKMEQNKNACVILVELIISSIKINVVCLEQYNQLWVGKRLVKEKIK